MPIFVKKVKKQRIYPSQYSNMNKEHKDLRIAILGLFFVAFAVMIVFRLAKLQIIDHNYYLAVASGQHEIFKNLYPLRGEIYVYDNNGILAEKTYYPLATNKTMYLLYAVPKDIKDPEAVMQALKEVFKIKEKGERAEEIVVAEEIKNLPEENIENEIDLEKIKQQKLDAEKLLQEISENQELIDEWRLKLIKKDDPYEPIKHLVSEQEIQNLKDYNYKRKS